MRLHEKIKNNSEKVKAALSLGALALGTAGVFAGGDMGNVLLLAVATAVAEMMINEGDM